MKTIKLFVVLFMFTANSIAVENNPVIMSASHSNGAILKGIDAVRYNPANLGLSDNSGVNSVSFFLLPNLSYMFENSFSLNVYNDYISKDGDNSWSTSDVDDILSQLDDKWRIQNQINMDIFSLALGDKALSININSVENIAIPKDFLELMLKGNEIGKVYSADELDGEIFNIASVELSYAGTVNASWIDKYFKEFSVGGTLRFIHSLPGGAEMDGLTENSESKIKPAYFKIKNVDSYVIARDITGEETSPMGATTIKGSFDILVSEAGMGFGTDIGAAGYINDRMKVGLSLIDVFTYINWYRNSKIYKYSYIMDGIYLSDFDSDDDSLFSESEIEKSGSFHTVLPIEIKLDYVWMLYPGNQTFYWTSSYNQGFVNELGSTAVPRFSTGFEWFHNSTDWFRFRSGITLGGEALYSSAAGIGFAFSHYAMDFAVENKYFYGDSSKGLSFSFGQKILW